MLRDGHRIRISGDLRMHDAAAFLRELHKETNHASGSVVFDLSNVQTADGGVVALLLAPEFYFWLAAAVAGMIFQQSSYRAGSLNASLPTSVVAKPLIGSVLGMVVLGEMFEANGPELAVVIAGVVVVIIATFALAR